MKKFMPMLMTAGVLATFVGCAEESDPISADTPLTPVVAPAADTTPVAQTTPPETPAAADSILVSLSVPNMV